MTLEIVPRSAGGGIQPKIDTFLSNLGVLKSLLPLKGLRFYSSAVEWSHHTLCNHPTEPSSGTSI